MMYFYKTSKTRRGAPDGVLKSVLRIASLILFTQLVACGGGDDNPTPITNQPTQNQPVAIVDAQQSSKVGDTVTVDGSRSTVAAGKTISYTWVLTVPNGSLQTLDDATAAKSSFIPDIAGAYQLSLQVSDGQLSSDPVTVTVQIDDVATNSAPNAVISTTSTNVGVGAAVAYSGVDSNDPDQAGNRDGLTFAWTLTAPSASNTTLDSFSDVNGVFIPDIVGDYTLSLVVTDALQLSSQQASTVITVLDQVTASASFNVGASFVVGDTVNVDGLASVVPDGGSFNWTFVFSPTDTAPVINNIDTLTPDFVPADAGEYVLKLSIVDAQMNVLAWAQNQILVNPAPVPDTPIPSDPTEVTLLNTPDNPIVFSDACLGDGNVTLNENGVLAISFNQDLVADSSNGTQNRVCQVTYSLLLPNGVQLATSRASLSGTETGNTLAVITQGVAATTIDAGIRRYNDVEGDFQLTSPLLVLSDSTACGGVVQLKTRVNIAELGGQLTIAAGEPAALSVTNSFSPCTDAP